MIDIKSVRNAHHAEEISNIVVIKSAGSPTYVLKNIARCLTLYDIMENKFSNIPVVQRVICAGSAF